MTALSNLPRVYRFLLSPGWLGRLGAALAIAAVMSLLGMWQLSRYEERAAINARIDAAEVGAAVPLADVLSVPDPADTAWTMVRVTGRFDPGHEILVRGRTVSGRVGFEVLTPLVLADGSAVLVNRGWVPPASSGAATDRPEVPGTTDGQVSVVGRVRPSESGSRPVERIDGILQTRRIHLSTLAPHLPYQLPDLYLQLESQQPPAAPGLSPVPVRRENSWLNAGYAAQWWLFAALVLVGFAWLARREARRRDGSRPGRGRDLGADPDDLGADSGVESGDVSGPRR